MVEIFSECKMKHLTWCPCYPSNTQDFKDVWVSKYLDWIRNNTKYYSFYLEHPNTNAHVHALVWWPKETRWDNWCRGLCKINKNFVDMHPATKEKGLGKYFLGSHEVPEKRDDVLKLIGYNVKEERGCHNLPPDLVQEGVEYYDSIKGTERMSRLLNINPLNVKNVVCYLVEQCNATAITDPSLLLRKMRENSFSFVALSQKVMRKAILELKEKIGTIKKWESEEMDISNGVHPEHEWSYMKASCLLEEMSEILDKTDKYKLSTQIKAEKYEEIIDLFEKYS